MRRRAFLAGIACSALLPPPALAEPTRTIAVLMAYAESDPEGQERFASLRNGLHALGWGEGGKVRFEIRWGASSGDRARAHARELVDLRPDVIVVNGSPGLAAVQPLTSSIPVVFVVVTDPVGAGFVRNLSRPAGNITGFSTFEPEIGGKWLEALAEAAPQIQRVGILVDPDQRGFSELAGAIEQMAPARGLETVALPARSGPEVEHAMIQLSQQTNAGLIVLPTPTNAVHRERLFALTVERRLPAIYPFSYYAREGGLMAYGFDSRDLFRRAAPYVSRILHGEHPGDLPVQAPTKFELVVNMKVARAIGLTIPPALLARADEVIE